MLININAVGNGVCNQKGIDTRERVRKMQDKITQSVNRLNYRVITFNMTQRPLVL